MLTETIYATHNIFDLDKLHRNLRRIMRRALATKVPGPGRGGRGERHITVLIITYLSELKPCLCDDNICFETTRSCPTKQPFRRLPGGYYAMRFAPSRQFRNTRKETVFGYIMLVSSARHGVLNRPLNRYTCIITCVIHMTLTRKPTSTLYNNVLS